MIIVGAGLSGLLTAWRCLDVNPNFTITIIDAAEQIGGDHTWSFNLTDVPEYLQEWLQPFIAYQWPRYDVRFPKRGRTLEIPYCTGNSESLRACVQPHIDSGRLKTRLGVKASRVEPEKVTLESGEVLTAPCVLDARGFKPSDNVFLGFQKFVGRTIRTKEPHGLKHPIIMDATVEQLGGYRFVYCLPFTDHEVLVEDTYYTDGAELSENEVTSRIEDYIAAQGWEVDKMLRQEKGVLPITLAVDYDPEEAFCDNSLYAANKIGIAGGFYHAVTGYSFPDALVLANEIANDIADKESYAADDAGFIPKTVVQTAQYNHLQYEKFFRLLNRMLFRAAEPTERYKVLERFYGLSQGIIERFYAGMLTKADMARILSGKPPVPLHKALYNFSEKAFIKRERAKRKSQEKAF